MIVATLSKTLSSRSIQEAEFIRIYLVKNAKGIDHVSTLYDMI